MFPQPITPVRIPCRACRTPTRVDRAIQGYGIDCATKRGLVAPTVRLRVRAQDGPTLLDPWLNLEGDDDDPDDHCDG